jgi:hypothetical protein
MQDKSRTSIGRRKETIINEKGPVERGRIVIGINIIISLIGLSSVFLFLFSFLMGRRSREALPYLY